MSFIGQHAALRFHRHQVYGEDFMIGRPNFQPEKVLFLSLYFKALKYTVKASEKVEIING